MKTRSAAAQKRDLLGRTIVAVDFGPFDDGRGGTAHDPTLTLDDGRQLWFVTEETEMGEYGVSVRISEATHTNLESV